MKMMKLFSKVLLLLALPTAVYFAVSFLAGSFDEEIPSVSVIRLSGSQQGDIVVPFCAVRQDDEGEFVYLLEEGKAKKNYITTEAECDAGFRVSHGIEENMLVILQPDSIKSDGQCVVATAGKAEM
ncbi:MAG: hypothetical protein IJP10_05010 [Clostridia bacterium]|nr:hypothetical protein [Clostridia bacterium]